MFSISVLFLTSVCSVHSNIHGLVNTCCIGYLTAVDSSHFPSPAMQAYHTRTSASVELPLLTTVCNSSTIGVVPITQDMPIWRLGTSTAHSVISQTEKWVKIFTNIVQGCESMVWNDSSIQNKSSCESECAVRQLGVVNCCIINIHTSP